MAGVLKIGGKTVATHDESTDVVSLASDVDLSNVDISNNDFSNHTNLSTPKLLSKLSLPDSLLGDPLEEPLGNLRTFLRFEYGLHKSSE